MPQVIALRWMDFYMGIQKQSLYATNVDLDPKVAHIPRFFLHVFFFFFGHYNICIIYTFIRMF